MQTPGTVAAPYPRVGQSECRDPGQTLQHRQQREIPVHIQGTERGPSPSEPSAHLLSEREEEETRNVYQWLSHAMEWGQGAEPRPGSPCLKETLESRTGAFSGDPDASFSPVLTPGLLPKAGAGTCLGEGHTGGALLLGAKSEAKVMSLFRAPLGVKGPTRASAILPPKVGTELIPSGGFSLKHLPHVRGRVSWSCPCTSKICALQNRERPAHCWGWGREMPIHRRPRARCGRRTID